VAEYRANIELQLKGYKKVQQRIGLIVKSVKKIEQAFKDADRVAASLVTNLRKGSGQSNKLASNMRTVVSQTRQATNAAAALDTQLGKAANTAKKAGTRSGGGGGGRGGFGLGSAFGAGFGFSNAPGAGLAQTAALGSALGPKGAAVAIVGKVIGDATGALVAFGQESAVAAAEVKKLEIALQGVAGRQTPEALEAIKTAVDDFNIPLRDATKGFTRLFASASASGIAFNEIEDSFRGLAAANKALGGDTEKLNGILLAATQVFAKGKVSAEELRGQIGERLPGALAKFAKANDLTIQELDKLLDKGEVTIPQFIKFLQDLGDEYEDQAKKIGSSTAEAGARFEVALSKISVATGQLLGPAGAAFQDFGSKVLTSLTPIVAEDGPLQKFLDFREGLADTSIGKASDKALSDFALGILDIADSLKELAKEQPIIELLAKIGDSISKRGAARREARERQEALTANTRTAYYPTAAEIQSAQAQGRSFNADGSLAPLTEAEKISAELQKQIALVKEIEPLQVQLTELQKQRALATGDENRENRAELEYKIQNLQLAIQQVKALEGVTNEERRQQIIRDFARKQTVLIAEKTGELQIIEERRTEELRRQQKELERQEKQLRKNATAAAARTTQKALGTIKDLREEERLLKDRVKYGDQEAQTRARIRELTAGMPEEYRQLVEQIVRGNVETEKQIEGMQKMDDIAASIGARLKTALVDTITAAIDGTQSLQDVLSNVLKDIGRLLINAGISSLGGPGGLFGAKGLPGFSEGGIAPPGKPAIVGENGPELIRPLTPTLVSPFDENRDSLANAVVNAGADAAFAETQEALGQSTAVMSSNAMRSEQQKLADSSSRMMIETTVINNVEYATVDQVQKAAKLASKEARSRVFADLKNKPSARAGVGV